MPGTRHHPEALVAVIRSTAIAGLLVLLAVPCRADIAPESGLLMHVQTTWSPEKPGDDSLMLLPVPPEGSGAVSGSCETQITHCSQITRSTTADGTLEFLIFFMRGANSWPGEHVCLQSLQNALAWPEAWQLMAFEVCGGGQGSLDPSGATHALSLTWASVSYRISDSPGGVVPIARVVMSVVGPGHFSMAQYNPVGLRHSCGGSTFGTLPVSIYAEAGMTCGYISPHCAYDESACEPSFYVGWRSYITELLLRAEPGSLADTTIGFFAVENFFRPCPMSINTHAAWCTGWTEVVPGGLQRLHVTADAAGLQPGTYETKFELFNESVSRCLPVALTVETPTATSSTSWGSVKALFRPDAAGDP